MNPKQKRSEMRMWKDERGMVAPLFGLAIVPMVLFIGIAVDFSRKMRVQDRMQTSIDAAVLYAMKDSVPASQRVAMAKQHFLMNFYGTTDQAKVAAANDKLFVGPLTVDFVPSADEKSIVANVDGKVKSMFGGLAHVNSMEAKGKAVVEAQEDTGVKVEIGMMIDLTGSMGATRGGMTKIAGLKIAAQDLLDKLYPAGDDENVRVGIAPMADYVNVGDIASVVTGLSNTGSYAKSDNLASTKQGKWSGSYSGYYGNSQPVGSQFGATSQSGSTAGATFDNQFCTAGNEYEKHNNNYVGVKVSSSHPEAYWNQGAWWQKEWHHHGGYAWHVETNDWIKRNRLSTCSQTADQSGQLITCVTERTSTTTRYTDDAPSSGNYVGPYNQSASGSTNKLNYSADGKCYVGGRELPKVMPLTSSKADLEAFFDNATIGGATPGHLGHAWAWYMISPKWSGIWPAQSKPAEYTDAGTKKIAIIMTDGEYNTQYSNATSKAQALELCAGMKAQGVEVYTIGFGFSNSATAGDGSSEGNIKQMLTQCSSGTNHYYFPYDSNALRSVFENIGTSIKDGNTATFSAMKVKE